MNIKENADKILYEFGLYKIVEKYGKVHLIGSYKMDIMDLNDLDISIEKSNQSFEEIFEMANEINNKFKPYRFEGMHSKKDNCYFYGLEMEINNDYWNIDIWFREKVEIIKNENYCDEIVQLIKMNPKFRNTIKEIKNELIKINLYGINKSPKNHYHSKEIYDAVLIDGILDFKEFMEKFPK